MHRSGQSPRAKTGSRPCTNKGAAREKNGKSQGTGIPLKVFFDSIAMSMYNIFNGLTLIISKIKKFSG
jgi:hypothetical protein